MNNFFFHRSVFGGTVGPNLTKGNPSDPCLYYDGIKTRLLPLVINCPSVQTQTPPKATPGRKAGQRKIFVHTVVENVETPEANNSNSGSSTIPPSPASPILKAQLSAPPKQKESPTKDIIKSNQVSNKLFLTMKAGSSPIIQLKLTLLLIFLNKLRDLLRGTYIGIRKTLSGNPN